MLSIWSFPNGSDSAHGSGDGDGEISDDGNVGGGRLLLNWQREASRVKMSFFAISDIFSKFLI